MVRHAAYLETADDDRCVARVPGLPVCSVTKTSKAPCGRWPYGRDIGLWLVLGGQDWAVADRGPRRAMPEAPSGNGDQDDEQVQRIREPASQGLSKRQVCLEVFGYTGGKAFDEVSRVLDGATTAGPPQGGGTGGLGSSSSTQESSHH